jgi:NAD(P)-dependent dehydrogenase (short-subunit alcohol dehydrogenase family)
MELRNKVAIITGGARGVGKEIALEFAKEGAKVVVSDIDIDNCELTCDAILDSGGDAIAIECDVTKKKEVINLVNTSIKKYQKIDLLVNVASNEIIKPFIQMEEKEWDSVIETNLKGVFLTTLYVSKKMVEQKSGKIINISSIAGKVGFPYASSFCASKAGVINLTRGLALELAEYKINVNCVVSGVLPTKMLEDILEDDETTKHLLKNTPINRLGKPEDIAKATVFLASNKSSYITGHILVVDGGWTCQ